MLDLRYGLSLLVLLSLVLGEVISVVISESTYTLVVASRVTENLIHQLSVCLRLS